MPTASERKALWFLAFVALSGAAVRCWGDTSRKPTTVESAALRRQIQRVDSVREARTGTVRAPSQSRRRRADKAVGTSVLLDLDRASAAEIEQLPGIGPALAERIVAHRDSAGPFGDIEALCDVRGIGPALVKRLRPLVTFTSARRPVSGACGDASTGTQKKRVSSARQPR